MLSVQEIHTYYGLAHVLQGVNLEVGDREIVALLGPNGAGKSTTMRMLTAQAIADAGDIEVLGFRLPKDSKQARAVMGVVPQLDNLDITLTVEQNLQVFVHLYRVPKAERQEAIERAVALAGPGDVIVIAGKGHEQGQEFENGRKLPFDDVGVAREALRARLVA